MTHASEFVEPVCGFNGPRKHAINDAVGNSNSAFQKGGAQDQNTTQPRPPLKYGMVWANGFDAIPQRSDVSIRDDGYRTQAHYDSGRRNAVFIESDRKGRFTLAMTDAEPRRITTAHANEPEHSRKITETVCGIMKPFRPTKKVPCKMLGP